LINRKTPSLLAFSMVRESLSTWAVIVQNNRSLVLEDGGRGACFVFGGHLKRLTVPMASAEMLSFNTITIKVAEKILLF
jgi:hypothetical protein